MNAISKRVEKLSFVNRIGRYMANFTATVERYF